MSEFSETIAVSIGAVGYEVTVAISPGDDGPQLRRPIRIAAIGAHVALPALIVGIEDAERLDALLRRAIMAAKARPALT